MGDGVRSFVGDEGVSDCMINDSGVKVLVDVDPFSEGTGDVAIMEINTTFQELSMVSYYNGIILQWCHIVMYIIQ